MSDKEFNEGHIVEGVDRIHTIIVMIEELLIDHPAIVKAGVSHDILEAQEILTTAYQKVGMLDES